ncbi:Flavin-linked sulfhydryl oxidase of the mitochondrial IMS [Talaromyces marneffei ATCC 18224]|uniref:Sulfhydryl oxidase n=2 Tax=Talaromyces marneffei TaxID=37727 RepID=B6QVI3_TALMQ|nr:uncharacterized protein EYB26_009741 [Talaromyces marneffei]EEA18988.1 FAD dependent sulfhydryl oxidase Erv1, putative [Talaromyces marneffei ATCC 18224]KAE8548684.1 hypothetical protein EYB25_009065 [Talaromyces marneffei]QGA22027.1 hypothetical protein EYB26_009741 [Talaromyces marneffei]
MSATAGPSASNTLPDGQKLPPGVVLDKDGKPCKTCTSAASWRAMLKQASTSGGIAAGAAAAATAAASATSTPAPPPPSAQADCPPDVEELGRSTWTFLHTLTATYPTTASTEKQTQMRSFLGLFSNLYPCWACAEDFRNWMSDPTGKNEPRLSSRAEFGQWMCEAHNAVNRKLGKKEFDCRLWEERWRTGWKDGRCD